MTEMPTVPAGFPDPASLVLPLGPMPTQSGEELQNWIKLYKEQLELRRIALSLQEGAEERAAAVLTRQRSEVELEQARLALVRERLEVAELERTHAEARAAAKHAGLYFFNRELSKKSVSEAIDTLGLWSRRDPGCDIRIIINSSGGVVTDGLALFDFIGELRAIGHKVTTVAIGVAASMAGVLLQAGDVRMIGRNASMLIHEIRYGMAGRASDLEDEVEFTRSLHRRLLSILAERSTLTERQIATRWKRKDWWLTAQEVVDLGFADALTS